jgi:hypothetical protein
MFTRLEVRVADINALCQRSAPPGPIGDVVSFVFFPNVATVSAAEWQKNPGPSVTAATAPSSSVQEGSHYLAAGMICPSRGLSMAAGYLPDCKFKWRATVASPFIHPKDRRGDKLSPLKSERTI